MFSSFSDWVRGPQKMGGYGKSTATAKFLQSRLLSTTDSSRRQDDNSSPNCSDVEEREVQQRWWLHLIGPFCGKARLVNHWLTKARPVHALLQRGPNTFFWGFRVNRNAVGTAVCRSDIWKQNKEPSGYVQFFADCVTNLKNVKLKRNRDTHQFSSCAQGRLWKCEVKKLQFRQTPYQMMHLGIAPSLLNPRSHRPVDFFVKVFRHPLFRGDDSCNNLDDHLDYMFAVDDARTLDMAIGRDS